MSVTEQESGRHSSKNCSYDTFCEHVSINICCTIESTVSLGAKRVSFLLNEVNENKVTFRYSVRRLTQDCLYKHSIVLRRSDSSGIHLEKHVFLVKALFIHPLSYPIR